MKNITDFLFFIIIPFTGSAIIFIFSMIVLRKINFNQNGTRKSNWRNLTPELLSEQIKYHNNAIYKVFEFYIKMILAIIGGIALIAVTKDSNPSILKTIIKAGGLMIYPITFLFCILIISHQRAKIERWEKSYKWYEIFMWDEFWFITITIPLATVLNNIIFPLLIENLN